MAMDKKKLERLAKQVNTVTGLCKDPNMNLKNSPPFILYVLPQIYQQLRTINGRYEATPDFLDDMEYMNIFTENLASRCQQCVSLFDVDPEGMLDKNSEGRRTLTKLTLAFSHMMYELKALFPDGTYAGDTFTITKVDAASWWKRYFQDSIIVTWQKFINALRDTYVIGSSQLHALKNTVDLTCNNHISIFEFDVFTKLFQPWSNLLQCWNALAISHPGYMAFCTYEEVSSRLEAINKPGSYVFRLSCSRLGQWAIGYVDSKRSILQMIPQNKPLFQVLIDGYRDGIYLYPDGNNYNPDLTPLLKNNACHIKVTEEQYETYCQMDTTYQLCKICTDRDKNTRLEPCGHLLCSTCLHNWQKSGGKDCPFCRKEISSTEPVSIEAFKRTALEPVGLNGFPRDLHMLGSLPSTVSVDNLSIYATPTNARRNSIHLPKTPSSAADRPPSAADKPPSAADKPFSAVTYANLPPSSPTNRNSVPPIPPQRQSPIEAVSSPAPNFRRSLQMRRNALTPSLSCEKLTSTRTSSRKSSGDSITDITLSALCQAVHTLPINMRLKSSTPNRSPAAGTPTKKQGTLSKQFTRSDDNLSFGQTQGQGQSQGNPQAGNNGSSLATLLREGFSEDKARRALQIATDNLTMAREILLSFS